MGPPPPPLPLLLLLLSVLVLQEEGEEEEMEERKRRRRRRRRGGRGGGGGVSERRAMLALPTHMLISMLISLNLSYSHHSTCALLLISRADVTGSFCSSLLLISISHRFCSSLVQMSPGISSQYASSWDAGVGGHSKGCLVGPRSVPRPPAPLRLLPGVASVLLGFAFTLRAWLCATNPRVRCCRRCREV